MPIVTTYTRKRIESLLGQGLHPVAIFKELKTESLSASYSSVARIVRKIKLTGSTKNLARSGQPRKLNEAAKAFINSQMRKNDETTSHQTQRRLARRGVIVHASTVRRSRQQQGWTLQKTRYCQLIVTQTKSSSWHLPRKLWRLVIPFMVLFLRMSALSPWNSFAECAIGEPAKRKPKPKHPLKVPVWAGIS